MGWGGTRKARCKSLTFAFKNRCLKPWTLRSAALSLTKELLDARKTYTKTTTIVLLTKSRKQENKLNSGKQSDYRALEEETINH